MHYGQPHLVVLSPISEVSIEEALRRIESQGKLVECTLPLGQE